MATTTGLMIMSDVQFDLAAFQSGDQQAIAELFRLYYRSLVYYAGSIVHDRDDIVVESFVKLMKKTQDFASLQNIRAFLYVATRNACYNYLQSLKVDARSQKEIAYLHDPFSESSEKDYQWMDAEIIRVVLEEVEQLPPQCRQVFRLLFFEQKNTQEIADLMGLSVKTIRNQKARAIQLLQSSLLKKNLLPALAFVQFMVAGEEIICQ